MLHLNVLIRNIDRHRAIREGVNPVPVAVIADGFGFCDIDAERENSRVGTGLAFCVDCECGAGHLECIRSVKCLIGFNRIIRSIIHAKDSFCFRNPFDSAPPRLFQSASGTQLPTSHFDWAARVESAESQKQLPPREFFRVEHSPLPIVVSSGRAIPERSLLTHEPQPAIDCVNAIGGQTVHATASCSKVMDTLRLSASIKRLSRLHRGIEPDVFQLETVLGVRSKAAATAEVPPSVSIMSVAVCIATPYGIRKLAASANYE